MRYPQQRRGMTFGDFFVYLFCSVVGVAFVVMIAIQFGWVPPLWFGPGLNTAQPAPTVQAVQPPAARPVVVQPAQPAPVVPTANIPAVVVTEYQPAPPADVPQEAVQPRTEIVSVQRAPEQTTIIRTVPQNPSGPPIVVDKGVKRRGAP